MKLNLTFVMLSFLVSFGQQNNIKEKNAVNQVLKSWHKAAAEANFDLYFSYMTHKSVFVGTDATENWQIDAFKTYSKPHFDKGTAWSFSSLERNIYFSDDFKTAWFDELLSTQMKICRGSGVLQKQKNVWKIAHYVLSISIPNENTDAIIQIKSNFDDNFIKNMK